ncbi:MAG TPA: phenylacetate-CoA oxygenase subunit PaaC [Bacteroidia bacterium]|nr:phenylacetate-CoA oxygenase subunit PaaC [Bacteroidia bacterium]
MNELEIAKFELCLRMGDSALILGHRLSEWCGHAPILEEDIALTNVALDFVGLSRNWLSYAALIQNEGKTEDDLAYLRDVVLYRNALITEQPNGDFAVTMARQFFYDVFSYYFYIELCKSNDLTMKGIAEKAIKEIEYHLRHSTEWMYRLGDGTEESHQKLQDAVDELWMFTGDLFVTDKNYDLLFENNIVPEMKNIHENWHAKIVDVFNKSTLVLPNASFMQSGSTKGFHTEHLGFLLAEMQYLQRSYPNNNW